MTEIIAEISGNHGGSLENALELIREAKWAGADAVKFQCFEPDQLAEKRSKNHEVLALADGAPLALLYRRTHTPKEWFPVLIGCCEHNNIDWFSSVFDPGDVEFLETMDCPRYKISAFEMLDWELIKAVKETGKPIVMSVRQTSNVTIMQATDYRGVMYPLGISDHGGRLPMKRVPMIEWHIKLPQVETPDSDFSLEPNDMRKMIAELRRREAA